MENKIIIKEYEEKYAEQMSKIIVSNLLKINSKDYGIEYAKGIKAKRLVVPASVFGCEFYHKLGYEYVS